MQDIPINSGQMHAQPQRDAGAPARKGFFQAMAERRQLSTSTRQWLTAEFFVFAATCIGVLMPRTSWYAASLQVARLLARTGSRFAPNYQNVTAASLEARLLHRFLDILAVRDPFFPIPVRVEGEEILRHYAAQPGGFVCCTAHIPFVKLFLPIARQVIGDQRELRVIARAPVGNEEVAGWNDEHWKAIRTDHAVLVRSRSLLRKNGCLLVAVDREQGEVVSANIFRFVGRLHSRVLMWFTQLQPNGEILLRIVLPPGPHCRNEEEIRANFDFVEENVGRILRGDSIRGIEPLPIDDPDESNSEREDPWSREMHRIQLYTTGQLEARVRRLQSLLDERSGSIREHERIERRLGLMRAELQARVEV